jgi:hypothetical protein
LAVFFSQYAAFQLWATGFAGLLATILHRWAASRGSSCAAVSLVRELQLLDLYRASAFRDPVHAILHHSQKQASPYPFYLLTILAVGCAYAFSLVFEKPALTLSRSSRSRRARVA